MTETIAAWDFRRGLSGWAPNAGIVRARMTPEGLALTMVRLSPSA